MTNEIETTKRNMFMFVEHCKAAIRAELMPSASFPALEESLEAHLEALRQDRGRLVEERDTLRNQLQAFEHANSAAGDELRAQKDQIGHLTRTRDLSDQLARFRLNQLNGVMQELSALRKDKAGTSAQVSAGNTPVDESTASTAMRFSEQVARFNEQTRKAREQEQAHKAKTDLSAQLMQQAIMLAMAPINAFLAETCAEIRKLE